MDTTHDWRFRLPEPAALLVAWVWAVHAIIVGIDYLGGDAPDLATRWIAIEAALPSQVWGIAYVITGGLATLALALRLPRVYLTACALAVALYGAMAIGAVMFVMDFPPLFDGLRYVSRYLSILLLWVALGYGTKLQLEIDRRTAERVNNDT